MYPPHLRKAIAMIELIFAIVVMGIVMMSAPMLISTAAKGTSVALKQEGIGQALAEINIILTHPWDENNTDTTCIPPVLNVTNGDAELNQAVVALIPTGRRVGVENSSTSHTFICNSQQFNASWPLGSEGGINNDIDDFLGTTLNVIAGGAGGKDYLDTTTVGIATNVQYIEDNATYNLATITYAPAAPALGSTNIKQINVTLTSNPGGAADASLDSNIVLTAFSCNVGGFEYARRTM